MNGWRQNEAKTLQQPGQGIDRTVKPPLTSQNAEWGIDTLLAGV